MDVWRIGDPAGAFPVWSAGGAMIFPGRWNNDGDAVIYASQHYSLAMLEKLAHWNGFFPDDQCFVKVSVPVGTSYEVFQAASHIGWNGPLQSISRDFGSRWLSERRSAILIVPSVIAPMENNVLVNPLHSDAARIVPGLEQPVWRDARLVSEPQQI
jgi:RES domain-containing protein